MASGFSEFSRIVKNIVASTCSFCRSVRFNVDAFGKMYLQLATQFMDPFMTVAFCGFREAVELVHSCFHHTA
jgi:hypothetical protein